jgi:hypothetical protein
MIGLKRYAMGGIADVAKKALSSETEEEYDAAFKEIGNMLVSSAEIDNSVKKYIKEAKR